MYEQRNHPLLSRAKFARRVARRLLLALFLVGIALGLGVFGYHYIGGLNWIDSLLNASMILGGMGPVDPLHSDAAKLFASGYALFSGLAFVGIAGLMIDRKSTRLNSSHANISYAVFCLKKKSVNEHSTRASFEIDHRDLRRALPARTLNGEQHTTSAGQRRWERVGAPGLDGVGRDQPHMRAVIIRDAPKASHRTVHGERDHVVVAPTRA